jgi:microcystin degradation protein MlrC
MRIFVGGLSHEASVFSPISTPRASFAGWGDGERPPVAALEADRIIYGYGDLVAAAAFAGHDVVQGAFYEAEPSAPPSAQDFHYFVERVVASFERAMAFANIDAVLLFQHGAQVAAGIDDGESVLLRRLRQAMGPRRIPIGTLLDLHGNATQEMVRQSDVIIACREYPHTDFRVRAAELVELTTAAARREIDPRMQLWQLPMSGLLPTDGPMAQKLLARMASTVETSGVLSVSVFHGFPASDHPDAGASILLVTDGKLVDGWALARPLADLFATACDAYLEEHPYIDADAAVREALAAPRGVGPVVIADRGDNPGGGGSGDATWLLHAIIQAKVSGAAFALIHDPVAVARAHELGEGQIGDFRVGGRAALSGAPVVGQMYVAACRSGVRQQICGTELWQSLGRSALLEYEGVGIVVNEVRQGTFSHHAFEQHGIEANKCSILALKSTSHFRAGFANLASRIIECDPPGTTGEDLRAYSFKRLARPHWPLDTMPLAERAIPRALPS